MDHEDFILKMKNFIDLADIDEINDTRLLVLYLKLGNFLVNYIKINKSNKNEILFKIFESLKNEFYKIQISNPKGINALYQLALDYNRLEIIKELLEQVSLENKILVMQNAESIEAMITNIKHSINNHLYIDKHTKLYYYNQLERRKDAEINFRETIKLLYIFNQNINGLAAFED